MPYFPVFTRICGLCPHPTSGIRLKGKDTKLRTLPKELLVLYNAVNGTCYTDPEDLEINTLKNAIYMSMHNDISFLIDSRLSLYEHQSTYSPNLPLRYLFYVADLYSGMTKNVNLYGKKQVFLPAPRFLIFYNGSEERPEKQELWLSSSYNVTEEYPSLELKATLLNINPGCNENLKAACKTLKDYAEYTARVRRYAEGMNLEDAVDKAISECIREGILSDFLMANKAEAKKMSIYEYDEELHMRQTREEGWEDGFSQGEANGISQSILTLLEDIGNVPNELKQIILKEKKNEILIQWVRLAAKVDSIEDFQKQLSLRV